MPRNGTIHFLGPHALPSHLSTRPLSSLAQTLDSQPLPGALEASPGPSATDGDDDDDPEDEEEERRGSGAPAPKKRTPKNEDPNALRDFLTDMDKYRRGDGRRGCRG